MKNKSVYQIEAKVELTLPVLVKANRAADAIGFVNQNLPEIMCDTVKDGTPVETDSELCVGVFVGDFSKDRRVYDLGDFRPSLHKPKEKTSETMAGLVAENKVLKRTVETCQQKIAVFEKCVDRVRVFGRFLEDYIPNGPRYNGVLEEALDELFDSLRGIGKGDQK